MKIKSKKGVELPMNIVIIAAILLIVMIVVIAAFSRLFGKETGQIEDKIKALDDTDGDDIINMFDKCPCWCGTDEFKGCKDPNELKFNSEFTMKKWIKLIL